MSVERIMKGKSMKERNKSKEDIKSTNSTEKTIKTMGTVICERLNVRKAATTDSEIIAVISKNDELTIDTAACTSEWYSVCTNNGVRGFCMKKFITFSIK